MIKKISILVVLLFSLATVCYAETNHTITFNNCEEQDKEETIEIKDDKIKCDVSFKISNINEETGKVEVNVSIENVGEKDLVLFDKDNEEKELKNLVPNKKLRFDDIYSGSKKVKGSGTIESAHYIETDGSEKIKTLDLEEGGNAEEIQLYIYAVEHTTKRFLFWKSHKYNIVREKGLTFNVNVEESINVDSIAESISSNYSEIRNEIEDKKFCNNPLHDPTLEDEKKMYQSKINTLKQQLDSVKNNGNYYRKNKYFLDALEIYMNNDLDSIMQIEECDSCRKIRKAKKTAVKKGHRCNYCNMSLLEIHNNLEKIYTKICIGEFTEKQKISEVEAMYKCAINREDWETNQCKDGIEEYYKRLTGKR